MAMPVRVVFIIFYLTNNSTYICELQSGEVSMDIHVNLHIKIHYTHIYKKDFILEAIIIFPLILPHLFLTTLYLEDCVNTARQWGKKAYV